jgi:hypothetical protein
LLLQGVRFALWPIVVYYTVSVILKTSYGKDVLQLYLDNVIDSHSIGYSTVQRAAKKGYNELQEIKLFEGSSVTFATNQLARGGSSEKMLGRMDILIKALRNGKYENVEIFNDIERNLEQLQRNAISTQPAANAPVPLEKNEVLLLLKQQINKFNGTRNKTGS